MAINLNIEGKEIGKSISDLFSPLTELAGLIGDQVRVYRQLTLLRTLEKAKAKAKKENIELNPPPLKYLIPFIENCSLESAEDELFIDMWSNLLLSSATNYKAEHNLFVRILNEIGPEEAKAFQLIAKSHLHFNTAKYGTMFHGDLESFWEESSVYINIKRIINKIENKLDKTTNFEELECEFRESHQVPGVIISYFEVAKGKRLEYPYDSVYTPKPTEIDKFDPIIFSILIKLGLISEFISPEYFFGEYNFNIRAFYITNLGAIFYESCTRKTIVPMK